MRPASSPDPSHNPDGMTFAAAPSPWPRAVAWALFAVVVVHAIVFSARVANPLVISDGWYFVDSFLRKYAEGQLTVGDFFAKRAAVDHALPFHKMLLVLNYHLFGVDLSFETWVGLAFAVATMWLLRSVIRRSVRPTDFADWPVQVTWAAICAIWLSLNSSSIFEWPMLALSFVALFLCCVLAIATWRALEGGPWWPAVVAVLVTMFVSDDGGAIAVIATAMTLALQGVRTGRGKRAVLLAGALVLACVAWKLMAYALAPTLNAGPAAGVGGDVSLAELAMSLSIPLSSGVLYPPQSQMLFHGFARSVDVLLAAGFAAAHLLFWYQALRRRTTLAWFLAIATMFLFYGLCAGVLIGRVPQYGAQAFLQPRYVVFYQLHVVALLLMLACWFGERGWEASSRVAKPTVAASIAVCVGLVLLQVPLDREGWRRAPYAWAYVEKLALQMHELGAEPEVPPQGCLPQITVCRAPVLVRERAVTFLRDHKLNAYSPEFRARHDLPPE